VTYSFLQSENPGKRLLLREGVNTEHCPTCESPAPAMHPAMQVGGEVQPCRDAWHCTERSPVNLREAITAAVTEGLGPADESVLVCTRVWEGWQFGTMTADDFHNACEDDEVIANIVSAILPVVVAAEAAVLRRLADECATAAAGLCASNDAADPTWRAEWLRNRADRITSGEVAP
jgi:hypothetical protein